MYPLYGLSYFWQIYYVQFRYLPAQLAVTVEYTNSLLAEG